MTRVSPLTSPRGRTIVFVGVLVGFLLNFSGWLGNNFVLKDMWRDVGANVPEAAWRASIWRDVFSFVPDYVYGFAIAWLCVRLRPSYESWFAVSVRVGILVSIVGGITAYFAIANSGFIPWRLALASLVLVLATKRPLAILAGWLLDTRREAVPD